LSGRRVARDEPLVEGRRYCVWLPIAKISQGAVCDGVGGNRAVAGVTVGETRD
jgi:hypothetical protein